MTREQRKCIIDADWPPIGEHDPRAYSRRCRRIRRAKRARRRDLALMALCIIIMFGAGYLANAVMPPVYI